MSALQDTAKILETALADAINPADIAKLSAAQVGNSKEIRLLEEHEAKMRPEAKTSEEHQERIRFHFEHLSKPTQVEVAKSLAQIAGDGTLLSR